MAPLKRFPSFLRRLVDAYPGGTAYIDAGQVFTFCNEAQADYFGWSANQVVGRSLRHVVPRKPDFWSSVEKVLNTGEAGTHTALSLPSRERPNLERRFVVTYLPDIDRKLHVRGVFITTLEVTETTFSRSKTLETLTARNKALEETVHERDLLLGIVSHEIRTPLTTIFGNAHLLLNRLEALDVESRTQAISDIRTEAERLNRLVENMLLLARAGAHAPVPTQTIAVTEAIGEVVAHHRKSFSHRCVQVRVKPKALVVNAQPDYLRQVLLNLLGNAEKYSPVDREIGVQARPTTGGVTISVMDHGRGIEPAEAKIIFQPFYRSALTSTTVGGAGIGLAVCKLLVQAQSGRISTHPRRGGGSVFTVTLPSTA